MNRLLLLTITFVSLFSCRLSDENREINRIFRQKFGSKPDYALRLNENKILCIKKGEDQEVYFPFLLYIFNRNGEEWIQTSETEIAEGCCFDSVEIISIDQKKFLYFEVGQLEGSMGAREIEFVVYDFSTDRRYSIDYEQYPESGITVTQFTNSDNLPAHPSIKNYLESRIKKSERIFKPDAREKLIRAFKSANKHQIQQLEDPESSGMLIRFKAVTTKEVLFKIPPADDSDSDKASVVSTAENRDYVVVSYFKGPVLAFKKQTGEYFCVYVPPLMDEFIPHLEFSQSGNLVFAGIEGGKAFCVVDLEELIYKNP